jgi:hypothetical protein
MGDKPLPAVPDRTLTLTTPAFPSTYADPLVPNDKLKKALTKAINDGPGKDWRCGLAIAHLDKAGAHPVAHHKGDRPYFGASMIKVASAYGLFELRHTLREIAKELDKNTSPSELLKDAARYLKPKILEMRKELPALKKAGDAESLPLYAEAFQVEGPKGGPWTVNFSKAYAPTDKPAGYHVEPIGHIEKMITKSDNGSAGKCAHACGWVYLNGLLTKAGFFDPKKGSLGEGLWLTGDYVTKAVYRVMTDNDQDVAQASTALALTKLFALLVDGKLFGGVSDSRTELLRVLHKAAAYPEVWINRPTSFDLTVSHNKLGFADLKPVNGGHNVYSECSIMKHKSGKNFVVVWLDYLLVGDTDDGNTGFKQVADVVRNTLDEYAK